MIDPTEGLTQVEGIFIDDFDVDETALVPVIETEHVDVTKVKEALSLFHLEHAE